VGLGKVAVYTADLASPWSTGIRSWKDNPRFWSQTVRWLQRRFDEGGVRATLSDDDEDARLLVDVHEHDGRFVSGLDVRATIRPPAGPPYDVVLDATAPGEYAARVPVEDTGPYIASILARRTTGDLEERRIVRGFFRNAEREQRECPADNATLTTIAEMTGGHVRQAADTPYGGMRRPEYRDISSWLTLTALLLFFGELVAPGLRGRRPFGWGRRGARTGHVENGRAA
jgi:hypothetical protein